MKEKIIKNKNVVILIASIVASALLVPSFISLFGNQLSDNSIVFLIVYALYLLANGAFIFFVVTKKELSVKTLLIPVVLFESAHILSNVYSLIGNNSWSSIFYLALYAGLLITYIVYMLKPNDKIIIAIFILLLICAAFSLVGLFQGSTISFSGLITYLLIAGIFYTITQGGNEE